MAVYTRLYKIAPTASPACRLTVNERITIRLDADILEYFRDAVDRAGGGNYQTLINKALREYIGSGKKPTLEETLRRVIREELRTSP